MCVVCWCVVRRVLDAACWLLGGGLCVLGAGLLVCVCVCFCSTSVKFIGNTVEKLER
jgi:hypothetical protein